VARVVAAFKPDTVVHCAAATAVDDCTLRPEWAHRINALAPAYVAEATRRVGGRMILVSTDFVFSGESPVPGVPFVPRPYHPGDPAMPISAYGQTKVAGEMNARETGVRLLVARTSWLYGHGKAFIDRMLDFAAKNGKGKAVTDQVGSPTFAKDVAEAIVELIATDATGLIHTANAGAVSRFDFLSAAVRMLGRKVEVLPALTAEFPTPARRPSYSAMCVRSTEALIGRPMRAWDEALAEYLREAYPKG
jgi:dTDP-4-dehydrorhamnose reductase